MAIAISTWGFLFGGLIKKYFGFDIFSIPHFAFFYIAFMLLLIFFLYKFFTKEKEKIEINYRIKVYNSKKTINKFLWDSISFTFLILPIVLTAILLSK